MDVNCSLLAAHVKLPDDMHLNSASASSHSWVDEFMRWQETYNTTASHFHLLCMVIKLKVEKIKQNLKNE